jgi:integrase
VVAAYLGALAATHGRSALNRRLAAIAHVHRAARQPWVHGQAEIRQTLRGIHRAHGVPTRPAAALTSVELRRLLATCQDDMAGRRDRALLLTGFVGALRRSELVGIDVAHLQRDAAGYRLFIPHAKRDPDRLGAVIGLPRARDRALCVVAAIEAWLVASACDDGPVFRPVTAAGGVQTERLAANGVWNILRRRAALAGLSVVPSERLSPHGLRAGMITEAYLRGALDEQVMQHARQKDIATTRGYRRRAKVLIDNPARCLDL